MIQRSESHFHTTTTQMEETPTPLPPTTVPTTSPPPSHPLQTSNPHIQEDIISPELRNLQELAIKGSWKTILETTQDSLKSPSNNRRYPHDHLACLTLCTISLLKLRRFADAEHFIISSLEPDLDNPSYRYEAFPNLYPDRTGSMLPFALRWVHAILPSFLSRRPESLDRLYLLLAFVRKQIPTNPSASASTVWRRREEFVVSTIISFHSGQKEYLLCLQLLNDMISKDNRNAGLLSKLGYVQLQFGDLEGAKLTFSRVEKIVEEEGSGGDRNLIGRNKALVYMVGKDYVSAVREYDECIERNGADFVAINNKALCLMYLRDLSDSIKVLENALERVPAVALNETLVVNLCSMYELAFVNHTDIKRTLSNWIARLAPDDFDSSCTRI